MAQTQNVPFTKDILDTTNQIILGYYPLRGKGQMCRLLCEYLHIPYRDLKFTVPKWEQFKAEMNINWTFDELPFLKDGETIITETYPICLYLIHKANRKDLLGTSLIEEIKLDSLVWQTEPASYICTTYLNNRDLTPDVKAEACQRMWSRSMTPKFTKMEKEAKGTFFFDKITLADFFIYETIIFLKVVSPERLGAFPRLMQIFSYFSEIPQIKEYQKSKRAVKQICPAKFCINWRQTVRERIANPQAEDPNAN